MRPVKLDVALHLHMETLLLIFAGAVVIYLMHRLVNLAVYAFQRKTDLSSNLETGKPGKFAGAVEDHLLVPDDLDDCVLDPWNSQQHGYPSTRNSAQTRIRND